MLGFYGGLFELVEVNQISGDAVEEEKDICGDPRRVWKLVAQTDAGQRLEFDVKAESLKAALPAGNRADRKNSFAGKRDLTSVARLTLIRVLYKEHSSGDLEVLDWWEAGEDDTLKWGTGMKTMQIT